MMVFSMLARDDPSPELLDTGVCPTIFGTIIMAAIMMTAMTTKVFQRLFMVITVY